MSWGFGSASNVACCGGVMHDAIEGRVGLGDFRLLVRRQADGFGERIDRHPVIGEHLEAPLAPIAPGS
jgi:hypothetical protein